MAVSCPRSVRLVKRFGGRPFVLLGVNGDEARDRVKAAVAKEQMTWRSWWNGGPYGPIVRKWNLKSWPTLVLIDAKVIIRIKDAELEEDVLKAIEAMVKEAETPAKPPVR